MEIYDLKCNYKTNPLGIEKIPDFFWKIKSDKRGQQQTSYRLVVASSREKLKNGTFDMWDSGRVQSTDCAHVKYEGQDLAPRTRYYWKIFSRLSRGQTAESDIAFFETAKLNERWAGNWITANYIKNEEDSYRAPILRKKFSIEKEVKRARLYICGLGYQVVELNGKKVGDDYLSPPFTHYDKTLLYSTYDVTGRLKSGANNLDVMLGNGWYNCFAEDPWETPQASWRHVPKLLAELHLEFAGGQKRKISTGPRWSSAPSSVVFNGIRNGEHYDARKEVKDWAEARIVRPPGGELQAAEIEPIRITDRLTPVNKWQTEEDNWVFDFGQNFSGFVRATLKGAIGREITIRYAEKLKQEKGPIDQSNIDKFIESGQFQTDKYIKGTDQKETWHPVFVYHGFRYVEVSGLDYEPELKELQGLVLNTDLNRRSDFECSSELLNEIQNLCRWSTISNFHSIPTDCPHREKNGWIGDTSLSGEQILFNFNPMSFYRKWMNDFRDIQRPDGGLPCVVPSTGWGFNWGNGPDWSSALTMIPWYVYLYCGDKKILKDNYENIKKHVSYMRKMSENYIVDYGIGDWSPPFQGPATFENLNSFQAPTALTDTAYFYKTAKITSRIASILGKEKEGKSYRELSRKIKKSFRSEFISKEGEIEIAGNCQTSTACLMYQELCPEGEKENLEEKLLNQVEDNDFHPDFGLLGNKYVLNVLGETGNIDYGLKMLTRKEFPGYHHWLEKGATTLWECWNGEGSRNHHMFSSVSEFLYKYIGGIRPDEKKPGFKHIKFKPGIKCGLDYSEVVHESLYGSIKCSWEKKDADCLVELSVPINTRGTLYLPLDIKKITEKGKIISKIPEIQVKKGKNYFRVILLSGEYEFKIHQVFA